MRTDPTDSTPTNRENGRTMVVVVLLLIAAVLYLLPTPDTRWAMVIGVSLGVFLMWGVWMSADESRGRDTNG